MSQKLRQSTLASMMGKTPKTQQAKKRANKTAVKDKGSNANMEEVSDSFSSEDDQDLVEGRINIDTPIAMTKKGFKELAETLKLRITKDPMKMELAYRLITLDNFLMSASKGVTKETVDAMEQEAAKNAGGNGSGQDGTPLFFKGDLSNTIMVNGIDQIQQMMRANTWHRGLLSLFGGNGIHVADVWVVKKVDNKVVSALVKFSTRFQKIMAMAVFNEERAKMANDMPPRECRINARDAFPREQMQAVKECYSRGYQLKKAGKVDSYRIHNTGAGSPTFEVRSMIEGRRTWGPPPPHTGDTPPMARRPTMTGRRRMEGGEHGIADMEQETEGSDNRRPPPPPVIADVINAAFNAS